MDTILCINAKTTLEEAWVYTQNDPEIQQEYYGQAAQYNWPALTRSPFWAYWFARNVIMDYWPLAEEYISGDPEILKHYKTYVRQLEVFLLKGDSLGESEHERLTKLASEARKDMRKPKKKGLPYTLKELEAMADAIAIRTKVLPSQYIDADDDRVEDFED